MQMKACVQTARTTKLACKIDCRTNSSPTDLGACMRGCTTTFRSAKDTCRSDLQTCISGCQGGSADGAFTGAPSDACAGDCGEALSTCAQDVITGAKVCAQDCRAASDRLSCLQDCAAACERLAGDDNATRLAALRAFPEVSVNPHVDSDLVEGATRRALARAGYALEDFEA